MTPDHVETILYRLDIQDRQFSDHRRETRESLREIAVQAKATNGRVSALELWKAKMDGAGFVVGKAGPLLTGTIGAVIGALVTKFLA